MTATFAGAEAGELRYKAWGETRYTSGTSPTTYKYTGQREESSFGLYYYGARWYDPALGRFTQPDTIVPGGVQGLDRYAYANNNPVKYNDPSGHGVFDSVSQFIVGFSAEFLVRNNIPGNVLMPDVAESLTVSSSESTSMLVGRVAADLVTIGLGVAEVTAGMGITGGGAVVSCGSTACLGAVATTAVGVAVSAYGATTALAGAAGLGGNLSLIAKNKDGSMMGANGPQVTSKNLWNGKQGRLDFENSNPGKRSGQIHFQWGKYKFYYDPTTNSFLPDAKSGVNPPSWLSKMLDDGVFDNAIDKGMYYLGGSNKK